MDLIFKDEAEDVCCDIDAVEEADRSILGCGIECSFSLSFPFPPNS
jgi:hypothetical protein